jgi:hypothetical protein
MGARRRGRTRGIGAAEHREREIGLVSAGLSNGRRRPLEFPGPPADQASRGNGHFGNGRQRTGSKSEILRRKGDFAFHH